MTRSTRLDYYTLEGFSADQRPSASVRPRRRWAKLWAGFLRAAAGSSDPVIHRRRDRRGTYYSIYDPTTHERLTCTSEAEVRQWLEQRYK